MAGKRKIQINLSKANSVLLAAVNQPQVQPHVETMNHPHHPSYQGMTHAQKLAAKKKFKEDKKAWRKSHGW